MIVVTYLTFDVEELGFSDLASFVDSYTCVVRLILLGQILNGQHTIFIVQENFSL